jgi:hypothetical protein
MPDERVQVLPRVEHEQLNRFVPARGQQERLLVASDPVTPLGLQLLQSLDFVMLREFVLQKVRLHQKGTMLSLYDRQTFDNILMGKVPVHWHVAIHLPNDYALVVGTAHHRFIIACQCNRPDPFFVAAVRSFFKTS